MCRQGSSTACVLKRRVQACESWWGHCCRRGNGQRWSCGASLCERRTSSRLISETPICAYRYGVCFLAACKRADGASLSVGGAGQFYRSPDHLVLIIDLALCVSPNFFDPLRQSRLCRNVASGVTLWDHLLVLGFRIFNSDLLKCYIGSFTDKLLELMGSVTAVIWIRSGT